MNDRWAQAAAETSGVTTEQLDKAVAEMQDAWAEVERIDKQKKDATEFYDKKESIVMALLKRSGKTKYLAEGIGTASIKNTYQVRTPKGLDEKRAFFTWLRERFGADGLLGLTTVHSATLNGLVNEEKEKNPLIEIPGLEAPTHRESISFRSVKK